MIIRFHEDLLLFSEWFREVLRLHFSDDWNIQLPLEIKTHVISLNNVEIDVIIKNSNGKTVVIELKERDYVKAIKQAIKRRELFDYVYVAINLPTHIILGILRKHREALEYGVGFISASDDCIIIRAYDKRHKYESKKYMKILDLILGEENNA